ncbi:hypothetical protein [Niallia circulans]|uniref:hypothetical protein n=1 Tax=Niallia circulans TaxID=1397 RepID=UPI00201D92C1|nr:hypothetical protein [Niallia circulans]
MNIDKKYWLIMPSFLIIGIVLILFLPPEKSYIPLSFPIVFWCIYYVWKHCEKDRERKQ